LLNVSNNYMRIPPWLALMLNHLVCNCSRTLNSFRSLDVSLLSDRQTVADKPYSCCWKSPKYSQGSVKDCPVNVPSRSKTTSSGKSWYFKTFSKYVRATVGESSLFSWIQCAIVVKQSTTPNIIVAPSESGSSVIQSVLICIHGLKTISNGCNNPCFACRGTIVLWQLSQIIATIPYIHFHIWPAKIPYN